MSERSWWPVIVIALCIGLLWLVWPPAAPSAVAGPPEIQGDSAFGLTPIGMTPLAVSQSTLEYDLTRGTGVAKVTATYRIVNPAEGPLSSVMGFGLDRGSAAAAPLTFNEVPVITADGATVGLVRKAQGGLYRWDFPVTVPARGTTEVQIIYQQTATEADRLTGYPQTVLTQYWPGLDLWRDYGPVEVKVRLTEGDAARFQHGSQFRPAGAGVFTASLPGPSSSPLTLVFGTPGRIFGLDPHALKVLATLIATALMACLTALRMPGDSSGAAVLSILLSAVAVGAALILPARPFAVYQWFYLVLLTILASVAGVTFAALLGQPDIEEARPSQ